MFDDSGGGGFSRWAWFDLGGMAQRVNALDREALNIFRDGLAGRRPVTVDQSYIDRLGHQIQLGNLEIDKGNALIQEWKDEAAAWKNAATNWQQNAAKWKEYAKTLEEERDLLKLSEQSAQRSDDRHYAALQRQRNAVANLRYFATHLQRFAALGLMNEPEYEQLAIRQQAAWTNFMSSPNLTEIDEPVKTLVESLERKVPR